MRTLVEFVIHRHPTAFVDFFERIQSMEKTKPGTITKIFSSHPSTDDRIKRAQREIQDGLKPLPEYVIDTSEFREVKSRLGAIERRRKISDREDDKRPTLRRRTSDGAGQESKRQDADERPRLKRREFQPGKEC